MTIKKVEDISKTIIEFKEMSKSDGWQDSIPTLGETEGWTGEVIK